MPVHAAVATAATSAANQRWKGKKKQIYQDDPEEAVGLLGDDEARDSEEEVERAGPARHPTHSVCSVVYTTSLDLIPSSDQLCGRIPAGNI